MADNIYQRSELDYLLYYNSVAYAELILNGDSETYLKTVTEYEPLDSGLLAPLGEIPRTVLFNFCITSSACISNYAVEISCECC